MKDKKKLITVVCFVLISVCAFLWGKSQAPLNAKPIFIIQYMDWNTDSLGGISGEFLVLYDNAVLETFLITDGGEDSKNIIYANRKNIGLDTYNKLIEKLDTDFYKYTEDFDGEEGIGVEMSYYDENGSVKHKFRGYIYGNDELQEITKLLGNDIKTFEDIATNFVSKI